MTWPSDDQGRQDHGRPDSPQPQPYQGSYPTSPFDARPHQDAYGGPEYDPAQYGTRLDPNQYGQPGPYAQPGPYTQGPYSQPGQYFYPGQVGPGQVGPGGPTGQGPQQGSRTGLLVGLAIAGLVLAVGVVAGVVYIRGDGASDPAANTSTTAPPATGQSGGPSPSSRPPVTSSRAATPDPLVPGWQVAVSGKRRLAYDVPPGWKVLGEETIVGFDDTTGEPLIGMSGAATYQDGYCAEADASWRAATGFSGYRDTDLALVATDAARKWGRFGYLGPDDQEPAVEVAPASELTVNGIVGAYSTATIRVTAPAPCAPPSAVVHTFALPADEGSYVFIVISDQEVPDALPADQIRRIIETVRTTG